MLEISNLKNSEFESWKSLATDYMAFYETERDASEYEALWHRLQSDSGVFGLGARINNELVGFAHYFFHASAWSSDVCYLQDLFVNSAVRSQGVGKSLIKTVTQRAIEAGSPRVYWLTQSHNEVARVLYEKIASHSGFIRYEINLPSSTS